MKQLTVIISYYKAIDNLKLILKALNGQSTMDFEVIVSEDDDNEETVSFIEKNRTAYTFSISHIHQPNHGFRKNKVLNQSILHCKTEGIAFIDGDCIPHRHFVEEYIKNIKDDCFLSGRSLMLGEQISAQIKKQESLESLNFFSLIFSNSSKIKEGIYSPFFSLSLKVNGLLGRNWGIKKKYLLEVNGFDEDYTGAGVGEDVDIEWRLIALGLKIKSIKNKAIVYHIYHPRAYSEDGVQKNYALLNKKKNLKKVQCLNGI